MFEQIRQDIFRYYQLEGGYPAQPLTRLEKIRILIVSHGFHVVAIYRFGSFVDKWWKKGFGWKCILLPFKIASLLLGQVAILLYGTLLIRGADIGPGLYIGHVGGIVVGPAKIGKNFTMTHNFTLGKGKKGARRGIPTIGDNVWVATNVVLYGPIKIGSGVAISPGAVVSKNICGRCLVAGNPAKIIQRDFDNSSLLFGDYDDKFMDCN